MSHIRQDARKSYCGPLNQYTECYLLVLHSRNSSQNKNHTRLQTRMLNELDELKAKEKQTKKTMLHQEANSLSDLIGLINWRFKLKNKQLNIFNNYITISMLDTELTLGWTQSMKWNPQPKKTKLLLATTYKCYTTQCLHSGMEIYGLFNGNQRLLVDLRKTNYLIVHDYTKNHHRVSTLSTTHLAKNTSAANSTDLSHITVCRWRTNDLHSYSPLKKLLSKNLHQVLVGLCLFLQVNAVVIRYTCQGWPISSINPRYWNCSQQCYGSYPEHQGLLGVSLEPRIKSDKRKVSV